ncbi:MAG: rRNA synthase [Phycisphaerales bacterium]|jgi:RluA family pseudouridine synthase|nr:rRNA synthase [Phycisphaerales bacterium]
MADETDNAETLLDRLARNFPTAKRQTLRRMIADGRVRVNGLRAGKATQRIAAEDKVEASDRRAAARQGDSSKLIAPLKIVFEDDDLLVVDKPAGLLTSTVPKEKRPTALALVRNYVAATNPKARVGLIHRLDRDASGLLVFSKSHAAYDSLKSQFFKHTVDRVYAAVVHGKPNPPAGMIESYLLERADGSIYSTDRHAKGQRAITHYEVLETKNKRSRVCVRLQTGRKHQIRVHLSERGCPIVGDTVYGRDDDDSPRLLLAAVELAFDHPRSGKRVSFKIEHSQIPL